MWRYICISCYTYDALPPACRKSRIGLVCVQRGHLAYLAFAGTVPPQQDHVSWTLGLVHCMSCNYNLSRPRTRSLDLDRVV